MSRRVTKPRAFAPDPAAPGRNCDMPNCLRPGEYRAPKSKTSLHDYWWFCLDHVRAYNAEWDYYKGMTIGQIEAELRADAAWQRPSWPLGRLGGAAIDEDALRDPLAAFSRDRAAQPGGARRPSAATPAELRAPLATLGLEWPTTLAEVKHRYKELAKRHHPDANGGDKGAEERLKTINLAYAAVRARLAEPAHAAPVAEPGFASAG